MGEKPWLAWRRRQRPISGPASFLFFPEKPKPLPTQPFKAESGSPQQKMGKDGKFLSLFFLFGFSSRVRAQSKGKKEGVTDRSNPPLLEPKTPWGEMSRKSMIFLTGTRGVIWKISASRMGQEAFMGKSTMLMGSATEGEFVLFHAPPPS